MTLITTATRRRRKAKRAAQAATVPNAVTVAPEYAQHHDVDVRPSAVAGNAGWRVHTRLDALLQSGTIGKLEWEAGGKYRTAMEHGELGGQIGGDGLGGGDGCATTARLASLQRLAAARAVLVPEQRIGMDALALDLPWGTAAQQMRCSDKTAKEWVVDALRTLVDHYRLRPAPSRIRTAAFSA